MTSSDDAGYVHDPGAFDEDGEHRSDADGVADADDDAIDEPIHPSAVDREFDWRGWILVGVIVFAFVVAPLTILLWPPATDHLFALIVIPLVPALALALTAVWATTRP